MLALELLVFALPCYLAFAVCYPLAILGLGVFGDMLIFAASGPSDDATKDLVSFTPFWILSMTAFIGLPALVMFAKLTVRVLRGAISVADANGRLVRTLKWASLSLVLMAAALAHFWPRSSWANEPFADAIACFYLSGLPILIPAFHLRRFLGRRLNDAE